MYGRRVEKAMKHITSFTLLCIDVEEAYNCIIIYNPSTKLPLSAIHVSCSYVGSSFWSRIEAIILQRSWNIRRKNAMKHHYLNG